MSLSNEERKAIVEFRIEKALRAYEQATHAGVTHLFGMRFVNTGICSKDDGRLYHKLFTMRQTGDYDDTYGL